MCPVRANNEPVWPIYRLSRDDESDVARIYRRANGQWGLSLYGKLYSFHSLNAALRAAVCLELTL